MDFAEALRQRLIAQAELFASLSSHGTITGTGRERALADLLRELLPRRVEVLSGVVAHIGNGKVAKSARQVDLLIADTHDFPVLARSGDLAVVLPDAVRAMVEVKSQVSGEKAMMDAIKQLAESRRECTTGQTWYAALFSYNYPKNSEELRKVLSNLIDSRNEKTNQLQNPALDSERQKTLQAEISRLLLKNLPDLIVSETGAIAIKVGSAYRFYECDAGRAAVVFVSEILTAVTTELARIGSISGGLTTVLASAVDVHAQFLEANKKQVLNDLPI